MEEILRILIYFVKFFSRKITLVPVSHSYLQSVKTPFQLALSNSRYDYYFEIFVNLIGRESYL